MGWTLAPLQPISQVSQPLFVSFVFCFFPPVSSHEVLTVVPSGCPCSGMKRQPVSTNPSPSENSSANASIGSTQSTPTSSMAWLHLSNFQPAGHHLLSKSPMWVLCFSQIDWCLRGIFFLLCALQNLTKKHRPLLPCILKWTWCWNLS